MPQIDFKSERLVRELIEFNAYVGLVFAFVPFMIVGIFWGLVYVFCMLTIVTTHRRVTNNPGLHEYREYVWLYGMKFGEWQKFESIEYVFVKNNDVKESLSTKTYNNYLERTVFDAYLKFHDDHKIRLLRRNGKKKLMKQLTPIVEFLGCDIVDYTAIGP